MATLTLTLETYRDKLLGGWLGKSIGLTLGAAQRGALVPGHARFYEPVPGQPVASIALDFPLVWLRTLEEIGTDVLPEDLAAGWLEHLDYQEDEFGYAALNLRRGLTPPASGAFSNPFSHGDGGIFRADLWAMLLPGAPQVAAAFAYHDAKLDHAEDGVWAAMFLAALASAAFFLSDPLVLLTIGLAMMPRTCRTARAVKTALSAGQRALPWLQAREEILKEVGHPNYTDVPQNMGFFTLGLLYGGNDWGEALCASVNCGYDAEVVGGAVGTIRGILTGRSRIPENWAQPMGDVVIPGLKLRDFDVPDTLTELAERTLVVGRQFLAANVPDVELLENTGNTENIGSKEGKSEEDNTNLQAPEPESPTLDVGAIVAEELGMEILDGEPHAKPEEQNVEVVPKVEAESEPDVIPFDSLEAEEEEQRRREQEKAKENTAGSFSNAERAIGEATPSSLSSAPSASLPEPGEAPPEVSIPSEAPQTVVENPVDLTGAIAWADNTRVKPLLVTPPYALIAQAGSFDITLDTGDTPTIAYNAPRTLNVSVRNRGEAFSGRISLEAPGGWQVVTPESMGQRQFLAAQQGTWRGAFVLRVPEGQAAIEITNMVTLRFTPDNGRPAITAEFLLMGASCWWLVGTFANFDGEGFDRSYMPEDRPGLREEYVSRNQQRIRWEKHAFAETMLNIEPFFRGSSGVLYGQTIFRSPSTMEARLVANTNSGVKVWLNGMQILRRFHREAFRPQIGSGPWAINTSLHAGDNLVLVKWVRGTEPLQFSLTLSDRDGRGLPEVGNTTW